MTDDEELAIFKSNKFREGFLNLVLKNKKAIVIDKNFPKHYNKVFFVDSGYITRSVLGKESIFYRLKENKDDIFCNYFGKSQIKILDG